MKEKELRIALVCYGGVSLAVYMHGVTKELWKLVRASRALHALPDPAARTGSSFADVDGDRAFDTEAVYFDLLRDIGESLDLRVLIDVVSGSSAGGINGVFLARALAHDLSLEPLTALWLENADVTRLIAEDRRATPWSKWFMRPLLTLPAWRRIAPDAETQEKLSLFVRSRWFTPPFDGHRLMEFLLEASRAMGEAAEPRCSLIPTGLPLSLSVTVTDFHGYRQRIPAHDPAEIEEREHRHVLSFQYRRGADGRVVSDFEDGNIPGLVFAARATSSFPGAFPPTQLRQLDRLLAEREEAWPDRTRFIDANFTYYRACGFDPEQASFIDGSVLNNKPFAEALAAIQGRPAYREVDRRVVYIDPNPEQPVPLGRTEAPGFFRTIIGALSDIPRNEPVRDELAEIAATNAGINRLRGVVEAARPRISALVAETIGGRIPEAPTGAEIGRWREMSMNRAAAEAGFAYEAYLRLKIDGVLDHLARLLAGLGGHADGEAVARMHAALSLWAVERGVFGPRPLTEPVDADGKSAPWVRFLMAFDGAFRARRLRFVMRELNRLYARGGGAAAPHGLDSLKTGLYAVLERLRGITNGSILDEEDRTALILHLAPDPDVGGLDRALARLEARFDLESLTLEVDEVFGRSMVAGLDAEARGDLLTAYLGFAFWDVLTFSTSGWKELDEYHAMKVDRVGPPDARLLRRGGAPVQLKGARLNRFGAFFSAADREHDYLLGRLHAAERAIDLVVDAAGENRPRADKVTALKLRAFRTILATERERLGPESRGLRLAEQWVEKCAEGQIDCTYSDKPVVQLSA
ncbi:patatin-like protein [Indioceanicola profundi]|uniref:patatin-like protein n=1 Tax=Indioceanicola profundi TaxID=2220096 RepID=UPI000E6ABA24|nr:patatin-like protein [Indioceanicola profundi]